MNNKQNILNNLPVEVSNKVRGVLKAYSECELYFENGGYTVQVGGSLRASYPSDHKYICTFKKSDIYNEVEQLENYINEFCEYPITYKGNRDYALLRTMREDRQYDFEKSLVTRWIGKINSEGDFVLTEKIQEQ